MRYGYRSFASLLALVGIMAIVGCGGGEEGSSESPTASIDNSTGGDGSTQGNAPAVPEEDPLRPKIKIDTSLGPIVLELDGEG